MRAMWVAATGNIRYCITRFPRTWAMCYIDCYRGTSCDDAPDDKGNHVERRVRKVTGLMIL